MPFDNTPTEITVDTPASLLIEAGIKLIAKPEHWCRGAAHMVLPSGVDAYCIWGAVRAAGKDAEWTDGFCQAQSALNTVAHIHYHRDIGRLNDDPRTTHARALEVMRDAAEIARGKL